MPFPPHKTQQYPPFARLNLVSFCSLVIPRHEDGGGWANTVFFVSFVVAFLFPGSHERAEGGAGAGFSCSIPGLASGKGEVRG